MDIQTAAQTVAPVDGAIRNPSNPHHFMVIKPIDRRVRVFAGDALIAESKNAVKVIEIGEKALDPVVYVPATDLSRPLEKLEKTSHCPLKGHAAYFAFNGEEVGWSYATPYDFANQLAGRYAFWSSKVRIEEGQ